MFFTPTKAVEIYKVSKPTLYADMKSGKLSYKIDDRSRRKINVAELERIYKKREEGTLQNETSKIVNQDNKKILSPNSDSFEIEIKYLKEMLDKQEELYKSQIEDLTEALKRSQEGQNKALLLLEDKTEGAGSWEKQFKALESRLSNQIAEKDKEAEVRIKSLRKAAKKKIDEVNSALEAERNKNLWQRLFG